MNKPNVRHIAVKALIQNHNGEILVLKQADPTISGDGQYHPPGGIVELGESVIDCVTREVKEETGAEAQIVRLFDVGEWHAERKPDSMQFIGLFYECRIADDNFTLQSSEVSAFAWVGLNNIDDLNILEPSKTVIKKFLVQTRKSAISKPQSIIDTIAYITVATVSEDGEPWNTPVAGYHFNDDPALYWASWTDNQHSKNIRQNGKAFIVIYDSTPASGEPTAGVYMQARVVELQDEQEVLQAALVFGDDPYNPSDGKEYLGDKPRRIYKATPQKVWLNDNSDVNGNFIDVRKEVITSS